MKAVLFSFALLTASTSGFVVPTKTIAQPQIAPLAMSSFNVDDFHQDLDSIVPPVSAQERAAMEDVMIEPNYYLTWCFAIVGALIMWYHPSYDPTGAPSVIGIAGGTFHMLFAALLWVQTRRVRLVFEKDAFEFYNIKGPKLDLDNGAWLQSKPDNYVSGTPNRWSYDTITNWSFFPSIEYPVICYFKETETPEEQWDKWFAAFDSFGKGQPHFFPGILNVHQFKNEMEKRGVKRKPIGSLKKKFPKKN